MILKLDGRIILHADLDAFFASVEQRDNPTLKNKPVLVGGTGPRSVVCAASYEARRDGCRSAMPMIKAKRLCPHATIISPRFDAYKKASNEFFNLLSDYSPLVEPLSIDEAFVELTGTTKLFGPPLDIALRIQQRVRKELNLNASIGIAPTKFTAKIASDLEKPKGLVVVHAKRLKTFLSPLPISKLWGVGPKMEQILQKARLDTFCDVEQVPLPDLTSLLGLNTAKRLKMLASGLDPRPVESTRQVKSIGKERTFSKDTEDKSFIHKQLQSLSDEVARNLRKKKLRANTLTLKIKFHDFTASTRQTRLDNFSDDGFLFSRISKELLKKLETEMYPFPAIRLLGVSASRFLSAPHSPQLSLFDDDPSPIDKSRMGKTLDAINEKFEESAIVRADTLELSRSQSK